MTVQCSAINKALNAKGYDNARLAGQLGLEAQRIDAILSGQAKPTPQEFASIAGALGLETPPAHVASVTG